MQLYYLDPFFFFFLLMHVFLGLVCKFTCNLSDLVNRFLIARNMQDSHV